MRRALALLLLAAVALAPAVSRAHLRISAKPTPAQENARFKWSNSCERVPSRVADHDDTLSLIPAVPPTIEPDNLACRYSWPETDVIRVVAAPVTPPALRAPPSLAL